MRDGLEVRASEPHWEGRGNGKLPPNTLLFIYINIIYYHTVHMCMISLDGEGNEVGGVGDLKERERPGALRGAGTFGPPAKGDAMKQTRAPRRLKTQPTGRPWRGQHPHR